MEKEAGLSSIDDKLFNASKTVLITAGLSCANNTISLTKVKTAIL